jgi:hypothetical protein
MRQDFSIEETLFCLFEDDDGMNERNSQKESEE